MGQQKAEEEEDKVEKNTHLSRERENQQSLKRVTQCGYSFLVFLLDVLYKRHRIISLRFPFFPILFSAFYSIQFTVFEEVPYPTTKSEKIRQKLR